MTIRLYDKNAYQTEFEAQILARRPMERGTGLVLDRTCFYPTSGGQPHDTGWLDDEPVIDVIEAGEDIVHVVEHDIGGDAVHGRIDWERRFDHMQQHTGQHLLSATFQDELGMLTVSFHLGEELSTVDLATSDLDGAQATRAERRVNEIISQDREVHKRYYTPDEADELPLRKPPGAFDTIRVVSVEGLDYSACCGTHCRRTGEIGLLKIRRWERRGDQTRVEFFCGWRAWADYAWKHHDITQVANEWSIQDRKVAEAALRTAEALRESQREVERLTNELLDVEADRLVSQAEDVDGAKIVSKVFSDRDQDEVRYLALRIIAEPGQVILFGIRGGTGRLVFGRSTDLDMDMPGLLRHICGAYGGGGGGQPHLAQGGGMPAEALGEALGQAREWVMAAVSVDTGEGA